MVNSLHPLALFRIAVLGDLLTREAFQRGELKARCEAIAAKSHRLPDGTCQRFSPKTIERWYYQWRKGGVDALEPQVRSDKNKTHLSSDIQSAILDIKKDKPMRSVSVIKAILEEKKLVGKACISRSAIWRFLKKNGLSSRSVTGSDRIERRRFVAQYASDIWHADVLHGPTLVLNGKSRKTYLVSLIDDASRAIMHSEFRLGEQAVDIEYVLKQAVLKRGLPKKIILDNGPGYRALSLQAIAARLEIQLVYCPAYEPQGKGKLERWHRTFREQCLAEIVLSSIATLQELNQQVWAWIESIYHGNPHSTLANQQTPLARWQADLQKVRPLGLLATKIDRLFYHHERRTVKKDACLSYDGQWYEVPYELSEQVVKVVIDPEKQKVVGVQGKDGALHPVHVLDREANVHRKRQRPKKETTNTRRSQYSLTDSALKNQQENLSLIDAKKEGE